jgi:DNA-binding NarL/FixJ family response regulator
MSITGISFSFRKRQQTLDDSSERLSLNQIASHHITQNNSQSHNDRVKQFHLEQLRLKRSLPDRAHLHITHLSLPVTDNARRNAQAHAQHASRDETNSQDARPPSSRPRANGEVRTRPNEVARLKAVSGNGHRPASVKKPAILVIHSRAFFRDCFVRCLEVSYDSHAISAFESIAAWRDSVEIVTPSVIVFFVDGNNADSLTDLQFLESAAADTPVVIMSDIDDVNYVVRALKGGARGYIPTSLPFNVAVEAVRLVEAGGTFVPVSSLEFDRDVHETTSKSNDILTERQMMVVEALCQGMANKKIAYELGMSEHTVKVHLRHIMRKLKVRNRTEVAVLTKDFFEKTNDHKWPDSGHKDALPS